MDRLGQLRSEAGSSRDSTLDTSSPPSEAFMTANESSSKYFSLSEVDSTFDISPIKDVSLTSTTMESEKTVTESDQLISNLSPIGKKDFMDGYKIGKQIEAANILSGGVDIFEDNDNSYDGDELVIDDNAEVDEKSNPDLKIADSSEATLVESDAVPSKDIEVILQIDGKNVDAIDIGNGLYLYRKQGQEELAAVQIIDDDQHQPSFKFLKVRENAEGNLEVYEEIQIEVPNEVPVKEEKVVNKSVSHVPIKNINKVISDSTSNKVAEKKTKPQNVPQPAVTVTEEPEIETAKEVQVESKSETSKKIKFSESRKSPVIGSFTPMTFHSTPNKEGIPLTKTMVDQQLHPSRHSDNIKKTIEVHTDSAKQRTLEPLGKTKDGINDDKTPLVKPVLAEKVITDEKSRVLHLDLENKTFEKKYEGEVKNNDKIVEEGKLVDEKVDEFVNVEEQLNKAKDLKVKSPDTFNTGDEKSIKTPVEEKNMNKLEKKEENKVDIVEPIKVHDVENKVTEDDDLIKLDMVKEAVVTKSCNTVKDNEKLIDQIVDVSHSKRTTESSKTIKVETKVAKQDSNEQTTKVAKHDSLEKVPINDIVVDQKLCIDNIKKPIDKKVQNITDSTSPKDSHKKLENRKEGFQVKVDNSNKKSSLQTEEDSKNVLLCTKTVEIVTKHSETEPIKQTVNIPDNIVQGKVVSVEKNIAEKNKENPTLQQKQHNEAQVDKEKQHITLSNLKSDFPASAGTSKIEPKEPINTIGNDTSSDLKSDQPIPSDTSKLASKVKSIINTNDTLSDLKSDLPIPCQTSKGQPKMQSIVIPNDTLSNLKSHLPNIAHQTSKIEPKVQSNTIANKTLPNLKSDLPIIRQTSKIEPKMQSITIANETLSNTKSDLPIANKASKIEPKMQPNPIANENKEIVKQNTKPVSAQNVPSSKNDPADKKPVAKAILPTDSKPINNNHAAAVPFGKWTEVNRQAFLNKIKESKVPSNSSNGKQIKNSNDLNRRDVLKKIDQRQSTIASAKAQELKIESQRQTGINTAKTQDFGSATRMGVKKEAAALANKSQVFQESRLPVKTEPPTLKISLVPGKKTKQETIVKPQIEIVNSSAIDVKKESNQRKEINNQDLIDKTIEEIINRPIPAQNSKEEVQVQQCYDEIEMKMNELHGKPFIERPIHELPPAQILAPKIYPKSEYLKPTVSKAVKIPNLLPFNKSQQKGVKENTTEIDSEEEVIIEHEPITGDMDMDKMKATKILVPEKLPVAETVTYPQVESSKKESIITERDFDKFARRNSISYEKSITVNFDGKEPLNVIQSVVQKDVVLKTYSKIESSQHDDKAKTTLKREGTITNNHPNTALNTKYGNPIIEDDGKFYQSKVKMAYQTAMTAKRQLDRPITIIEDRPVKVVYMDTNTEFISNQLNVQGKELSPAKKPLPSIASITTLTTDSQDSDNTLDSIDEEKLIDDTKIKTKHQRKQVLTPVETPELELIEPNDLGIDVSPKKKRKTEEKIEKNIKTLVPKKSYLLGRGNTLEDSSSKPYDFSKTLHRDTLNQDIVSHVTHKNTASAIDSLVKAAELLETQSGNMPTKAPDTPISDIQQNTPIKRGRGRPRKYPLPEGTPDRTKVPSPQKKPRLIDAKVVKSKDTDDDSSTDDDVMIKENWTMGKINENIVCPICKKLFRSENVVFKHVKHCTGPSPSRSDSENKSPRRYREESQESESRSYESKSDDNMEVEESESSHKDSRVKRKSKDSQQKIAEKDDIIIIEDTPLKPKLNKDDKDKRDEPSKSSEAKKTISKSKVPEKVNSLVCEFCGKTFRQLSYLVSHKLQHGKDATKKTDSEPAKAITSVFSCEVCNKEFRKLHHLVQHRIIHNQSNVPAKMSRKSSSEQNDSKVTKDQSTSKPSDEASAAFRCEPCDKSFRKLHHLVEHRETHVGIDRQKNTVQANAEKLPPPPQCDICDKTFRKLHHLIEHNEQHMETSSEKSDDKSIKSSLSTRDIIHECSLCYMVFPNEHSLNKHTIICQRKKKQSASKQAKQTEGTDAVEGDSELIKNNENETEQGDDDVTIVSDEVGEEKPTRDVSKEVLEEQNENKIEIAEEPVKTTTLPVVLNESLKPDSDTDKKEDNKPIELIQTNPPIMKAASDLPVKIKKSNDKTLKPKDHDTPRKKIQLKDKVEPTVTKRNKPNIPLPVVEEKATKPAESSDDDEARYMLNPDYKFEDNEGKLFMKVRANKRNSLQIERPNSKDLVKRRISLQHPLKVPRLKAKPIQNKMEPKPTSSTKTVVKAPKPEPAPSTDSDDSDVKYSFPKNAPDKVTKPNLPEPTTKESVKKTQRKSLIDKRKSLSSIAKRKSLGKAVISKQKVKPSPVKQVRKRTTEVEHRCDCGQLFSSAALLSRHTTLAHTPPRIRRRRSPPPETNTKPADKPAPRKPSLPPTKTRPSADLRKSSIKSDASIPNTKKEPTKRKSSIKPEPKTPNETRKSPKNSEKTEVKSAPTNKLRRYAAHKGVPVPEKMRKLMEKSKK